MVVAKGLEQTKVMRCLRAMRSLGHGIFTSAGGAVHLSAPSAMYTLRVSDSQCQCSTGVSRSVRWLDGVPKPVS